MPAESHPARAPSRSDLLGDVAVAVVVFALSLALLAAGDADNSGVDALGVLLTTLASLPLVARRAAPLGVFVVMGVASAALRGIAEPAGPPLGPTVALYFLAACSDQSRAQVRLTLMFAVVLLAAHVTAIALQGGNLPATPVAFGVLVWGGAWLAGDRARLRQERMAELEQRALRAEREAERERRLAAAEERTRIARDLHDSAGHAINVILVHAGLGRVRADRDAVTRETFETIEEVARQTVADIDQLVGALREEASGRAVEPPPGWPPSNASAAPPRRQPRRHDRHPRRPASAITQRRPGRLPHPAGGAHERRPPRKRLRRDRHRVWHERGGDRRRQPHPPRPNSPRHPRRPWAHRHARARGAARRQPRHDRSQRALPRSRAARHVHHDSSGTRAKTPGAPRRKPQVPSQG